MKKIIKKNSLLNGYDHDVEQYTNTFSTFYTAACSRVQLNRFGWMVRKPVVGSCCDVVAYRRVK